MVESESAREHADEQSGHETVAAPNVLIEELAGDSVEPPPLVVLSGYLGTSTRGGYHRLYLTLDLSEYVEIPVDQIVRSERLEGEPSSAGATILWVNPQARLLHTRSVTLTAEAEFLSGNITGAYLEQAVSRASTSRNSVRINYPRTEDRICGIVTYCSSCVSVFGTCPTRVGLERI